ncbi:MULTISPECIES: hypothetical protein [Salinicola]|uniref:Uncharacterized protein n=1 Tax=Salinicola endophyticus TaxID=1949083 RepID=A0AB74UG54_9GAMM|nr:hypothetical protein [Salinicola sp. JS01]WIX33228.1 hypothetical protein QO259_00785 [Salinicola sp. JS01]
MKQKNHALGLAIAEAIERIASTIVAACILGGVIAHQIQLAYAVLGGGIATVVVLVAVVLRVRINQSIDAAKEADGQ